MLKPKQIKDESESDEVIEVDSQRGKLTKSRSLINIKDELDLGNEKEEKDIDTIDTNVNEKAQSENIKVFCRVRPVNEQELEKGINCVNYVDEYSIQIKDGEATHQFKYNKVFQPDTTQFQLYELTCQGVVDKLLSGYNSCVLAYGQTGTGKTFTMLGPNGDDFRTLNEGIKQHQEGIIPRLLVDLFESLENLDKKYVWSATASYLEIYNEILKDLLISEEEIKLIELSQPKTAKKRKLEIMQLGQTIAISNAKQEPIRTHFNAYDLLMKGAHNRVTASTNSNKESSRSHAIFIITLEIVEIVTKNTKKCQLSLVDLAGSEQVSKTGAIGDRLGEAKYINKSLFELGNVIKALSSEKIGFVPYRNSKLTRILQNSIGGNSSTRLIITCSPNSYNSTETLSTLRFGDKTKSITNKIASNNQLSAGELLLLLNAANQKISHKDEIIRQLNQKLKTLEFLSTLHGDKIPNNDSNNPILKIEENPVEIPSTKITSLKINKKKSSVLKHLKTSFLCPLSNQIMVEPVVAFDGFTYERKNIEKWFSTNSTSPMLNTFTKNKQLFPNKNLEEELFIYSDEIKWYLKTLKLSLNDQPVGVLLIIFRLVDAKSLCSIESVCKRWKRIVDTNPSLWSQLCSSVLNINETKNPKLEFKKQHQKKAKTNPSKILSLFHN